MIEPLSILILLLLAREGAKRLEEHGRVQVTVLINEFLADGSIEKIERLPGETVYKVFFDREDPEASRIEERRVSGVGFEGFTLAGGIDDAPDNMGDFCPWTELGLDVFTTIEEAEAALETLMDAAATRRPLEEAAP